MNLCDTHCHLFQEYYPDIDNLLQEAAELGVKRSIVSGCDIRVNPEVLELIEKYSNLFGVIGIHPEEADNYSDNDIDFIKVHINHKKILGIGEIGLDYHYTKENKEKQIILFEKQLKLAQDLQLPVVIHSREATEDTIQILKKYDVKGVIHSFSGSLETALIYIKMGFYLGINGVITFKNCNLKDLLPQIFDHIILETDSPYLTPHPYRGKQNAPKYIYNIASFIADYLNIPLSQVEKVTNENVETIFDFSRHS